MTHLFPSLLVAGSFCLLVASAFGQSVPPLVVGQPGSIYQVFSPPKNIRAPVPIETRVVSARDSLDIDQDGLTDLRFQTSTIQYGVSPTRSGYKDNDNHILVTNPNLEIAAVPNTPLLAALPLGDILQPSIRTIDRGNPTGYWSSLANRATYTLSSFTVGSGYGSWGQFISGTNYMGMRLRVGNTWRYGWIRIKMVDHYISHYQVEAYALQAAATPLPVLPAQAAAAWQVYPLPATESLTIQAPAAGPGRATLLDDLGRAVSPAVELASGKTAQLDVAGLPPGLYLLRVQTPTGSFVRRVAKR